MAADNYLGLVNRVLKPLNEVVLTSSTFLTAEGIYADARDAINQGLFDVYTYKNILWPFLFSETTFQTTEGTIAYTKPATVTKVDWSSFVIKRPALSVTTLTRSSFTVTVTTSAAHNFVTGDYVEVLGATPSDYNLDNVVITVTGSTTFTFTVDDDTLTTPATGTIIVKSNTLKRKPLAYIDKDEYIKTYSAAVENATQSSFRKPEFVSRTPANNFIVFYPADRAYDISYSAYSVPSKLSAYGDNHSVPEQYEQAAVDKALHYIYMFRDNMEEAAIASKRAEDRLEAMVRVLSPFSNNMVTP